MTSMQSPKFEAGLSVAGLCRATKPEKLNIHHQRESDTEACNGSVLKHVWLGAERGTDVAFPTGHR